MLLDEVGRGTSTFDGLAIAWAVVEALHNRAHGAKVLFATHFHGDAARRAAPGACAISTSPSASGTTRSSSCTRCSRAARPQLRHPGRAARGPSGAGHRAIQGAPGRARRAGQLRTDASDAVQLGLFAGPGPDPLLAELASLDLAHLTPLEALNLLAKWQQRLGGH